MSLRKMEHDKALVWYVETYDLIPQLSAHPLYRFKNRATDKIHDKNIRAIQQLYENSKNKKVQA